VSPRSRLSEPDAEFDAAEPVRPAEPALPERRASLTPAGVLALQRSAGNAAVRAYLARDDDPPGATATAPEQQADAPEQQADAPELQPESPKSAPEHPPAEKLGMDLASGEKVLTNAFGAIKKIAPGKVELLGQAAFQVAYDKVYGSSQYSWEKYVTPKFGNLEGFAHDNVNYINTALAHLDTVAHEMLHNNVAADWRGVVGHDFDEGATEILTIAACKKLSVAFYPSYPGENSVVQAVLDAGVSFDDLTTAYLTGGAQAKIADFVDKNCKESFAKVKEYMAAQSWAAARAALAKK
jgi:hypothetical protein